MATTMAATTTQELRAEQEEAVETVSLVETASEQKVNEEETATAAEQEVAEVEAKKSVEELKTGMAVYKKEIVANASTASIMKAAISEIMGPIWEEFKGMSWTMKVLVMAGITAIVVTAGYFSWKLVAGNWTQIRAMAAAQLQKGADFVKPKTALKDEKVAVKALEIAMVEKKEDAKVSKEESHSILKYAFKAIGEGLIEGILAAMARKKGTVDDSDAKKSK